MTDQLPEVDSTGQSLSRTDQLLAEWTLQCPETATVGRLCSVLEELGRQDARDALYRFLFLLVLLIKKLNLWRLLCKTAG